MKYLFVTLSIIAIWVVIVVIINLLNYSGIILPLVAIILTLILFIIGFEGKR